MTESITFRIVTKDDLGISIHHKETNYIHTGNSQALFTLQTISKVITLALALLDRGEDRNHSFTSNVFESVRLTLDIDESNI